MIRMSALRASSATTMPTAESAVDVGDAPSSAPHDRHGQRTRHARDEHSSRRDTSAQLHLANVSKTYSRKDGPVLSGVDLAIGKGELVSLLGPSGCGKSTMLRLVAGFIRPETGRIEIAGKDVTHTATHRRGVGIVHQSHALWPHLTVAENVGFGLEMRKMRRHDRERRVLEMLELVGLADHGRRMPTQLSGGQQQRVALARALVVRPDVLLLDEPLSSLDANLRVHLREEIRRIQRELGVTTLFVTHDREEAMAVSDRIVILEGGRIAQQGTATELYRNPVSHFVMRFTGSLVSLPATVVDATPDELGVMSPMGRFGLRRGEAEHGVGDEVRLCMRPDDLRIVRSGETNCGQPRLTGTLDDVAFLGTSTQVRLRLSDGEQIEVRLPARQIADLPPWGSPVELVVDPNHINVFAA